VIGVTHLLETKADIGGRSEQTIRSFLLRRGKMMTFSGATILTLAGLAALGASPLARADLDDSRFELRGFGTAALTTQESDGLEFRRHAGQPDGLESGHVDIFTDSIAGAQANFRAGTDFDMVLQAVTRLNVDGDWHPSITQAFVRYSPDGSLALRAGRIGFDIYLLAESRQVGYSYVPLRPSVEFYGLLANDSIDGGDISYTRRAGAGLVRGRLFAGRGSDEMAFPDGGHQAIESDVVGASFDYIVGGWTARIAGGRWRYDVNPDAPLLVGALRMTGMPQALAIAAQLDQPTFKTWGVQLGVAYDEGPLKAQLMWSRLDSDPIFGPDTRGLYAFAGYRLAQWTPYASFSRSRDVAPVVSTGLPGLPEFAPLEQAVLDMQYGARTTQRTASIGVRYDIAPNIDLKLQVDRARIQDSALVFDRRIGPRDDADMTVIAFALDFVF
jgi:hypothetical protein